MRWKIAFGISALIAIASIALLLLVVRGERGIARATSGIVMKQAERDREALEAMRIVAPILASGIEKTAFADSLRQVFPNSVVSEDTTSVSVDGTRYLFDGNRIVRAVPDASSELVLSLD